MIEANISSKVNRHDSSRSLEERILGALLVTVESPMVTGQLAKVLSSVATWRPRGSTVQSRQIIHTAPLPTQTAGEYFMNGVIIIFYLRRLYFQFIFPSSTRCSCYLESS